MLPSAPPHPNLVYYEDCPLLFFERFIGRSYFLDLAQCEILLFPGAWIKALVEIPESLLYEIDVTPHTRSTHARLGLDVGLDQTAFQRMLFDERTRLMCTTVSNRPVPK